MAESYSRHPTRALLVRSNQLMHSLANALSAAPGSRTQMERDLMVDAEALAIAVYERRKEFPEGWPDVVLDIEREPGWVWLGYADSQRRYPLPALRGLATAIAIIRRGSVEVAELAPDANCPSETVRNRLARLALWADKRCPALAVVLRSSITIADGLAVYDRQFGPRVLLCLD